MPWLVQSFSIKDQQEPKVKDMSCSVPVGTLIRDCKPTKKQPKVPLHRRAGAEIFCEVEKDLTSLMFHYCDSKGADIDDKQPSQPTWTTTMPPTSMCPCPESWKLLKRRP